MCQLIISGGCFLSSFSPISTPFLLMVVFLSRVVWLCTMTLSPQAIEILFYLSVFMPWCHVPFVSREMTLSSTWIFTNIYRKMPYCLEIRKKVSQLIFGIKNQVENSNKNKNGTIFVFGAKIVISSFWRRWDSFIFL